MLMASLAVELTSKCNTAKDQREDTTIEAWCQVMDNMCLKNQHLSRQKRWGSPLNQCEVLCEKKHAPRTRHLNLCIYNCLNVKENV